MNGWKIIGAIVIGLVVAGVGGTCGRAFTDWLAYSGLQARIAQAEEAAVGAVEKVEQCCDTASENNAAIAAIKTDVKNIEKKAERIERNLYEFLVREGMRDRVVPPPEPEPEEPD